MTEQPKNESGDETAEPTRAWAPVEPVDVAAPQPNGPDDIADDVADAIDEGMPLIPEDEAAPTGVAAEPVVSEPEPVPVESEPAPVEPEPLPVEPEPVSAPAVPEPAPAEPEAVPEPTPETAPEDAEAPTAQRAEGWHPVESPAAEPTRVLAEEEPVAPPTPDPSPAEVTAPTAPVGVPATLALPPEAPVTPTEAIFRDSPDAIPEPYADPLSEEAQKLAAERAARKEARDAALTATAPQQPVAVEPVVVKERSNDKFFGSLGIFGLRLAVAAVFAIRGYQMLADLTGTQEQLAQTLLAPYASILALVVGIAHLAIALGLILGLLTRVTGLGVALVAGSALAFVWWGPWSPFVAGRLGFLGEFELVLTAVGVLLLFIGGGGWSIDRSFRSARAKDRAARQLAP